MRHYLLFVSTAYAYSIMRPLEDEIRRRGDEAAWYIEPACADLLRDDETRMRTFWDVHKFNPIAVFAPGNWIYDFFPGVKVEIFHGYPIAKRHEKLDNHFKIRNWFDIYCTQGETSTIPFKQIEKKKKFFKVYETGWPKVDAIFRPDLPPEKPRKRPTVLYATTFSRGISSAWIMPPVIDRLAKTKPWDWVIILHPLITDEKLIHEYGALAAKHDNVKFLGTKNDYETLRNTDVMLSDSSSIIVEYELLDKPVVTYRNTQEGPHLLNVTETNEIAPAIELALTRPEYLMNAIHLFTEAHEYHRDGKNSARVLDAVDDYIANYKGKIPSKPLNIIRRIKLSRKVIRDRIKARHKHIRSYLETFNLIVRHKFRED